MCLITSCSPLTGSIGSVPFGSVQLCLSRLHLWISVSDVSILIQYVVIGVVHGCVFSLLFVLVIVLW